MKKRKGTTKPKTEYLRFADMPSAFMENTGFTLADYSVAIGYFERATSNGPTMLGSGVLVRRGNRFGVLTAYHCVHAPGPDLDLGSFGGHKLALLIKGSHAIHVPPEVVAKHGLAKPDAKYLEPDLAFLEILPSSTLSSIKAISSFWSLDETRRKQAKKFQKITMPFTVIGFPGEYQQRIDGRPIRQIIKHMAYFYAIDRNAISRRRGWDYLEAANIYDEGHGLPSTFAGVSGGPVWGLQIRRNKENGLLELKDFCLTGIAFLQEHVSEKKILVRAHYTRSIYELAWRSFKNS